MRKLLGVTLMVLGLVSFTGCSNGSSPATGETAGQTTSAATNTEVKQPPQTAATGNTQTGNIETNQTMANNTNEVAVLKTSAGEMVIEFWPDVAPATVENFKTLAKKGFYDGTAFHRIIKGFMIQGGDPLTKDQNMEARWGTGDPGYKIKAEFNERKHDRGVLSMARSQDPNSAGSQFFVCLGPAPFLDNKYTAFGKVIKGDDVLGKLGDSPVGMGPGGEQSRPLQRVALESVKIVPASEVK